MATVVGNFAAKPAVDDNVKNFFFDRIISNSILPRINSDPITFVIPSIDGKSYFIRKRLTNNYLSFRDVH